MHLFLYSDLKSISFFSVIPIWLPWYCVPNVAQLYFAFFSTCFALLLSLVSCLGCNPEHNYQNICNSMIVTHSACDILFSLIGKLAVISGQTLYC